MSDSFTKEQIDIARGVVTVFPEGERLDNLRNLLGNGRKLSVKEMVDLIEEASIEINSEREGNREFLNSRDEKPPFDQILFGVKECSDPPGGLSENWDGSGLIQIDYDGEREQYMDEIDQKFKQCRYLIGEIIGKGNYGVVYKAWDRKFRKYVVFKKISNPNDGRILVNEGRIMAKYPRMNVVDVFDLVSSEEGTFIIMEYIEGGNLDVYSEEIRSGDLEQLRAILDQLEELAITIDRISGYDENGQNIPGTSFIHRDIKPSNILVAGDGRLVLCDFGISVKSGTIDLENGIPGSLRFIPPERFNSRENNILSEEYGFALVVFLAISGCYPYYSNGDDSLLIGNILRGNIMNLVFIKRFTTLFRTWLNEIKNKINDGTYSEKDFDEFWNPRLANPQGTYFELPDDWGVLRKDLIEYDPSNKANILLQIEELSDQFNLLFELSEQQLGKVSDVFEKALNFYPQMRFPTNRQFIQALRHALED